MPEPLNWGQSWDANKIRYQICIQMSPAKLQMTLPTNVFQKSPCNVSFNVARSWLVMFMSMSTKLRANCGSQTVATRYTFVWKSHLGYCKGSPADVPGLADGILERATCMAKLLTKCLNDTLLGWRSHATLFHSVLVWKQSSWHHSVIACHIARCKLFFRKLCSQQSCT